MQIDRVNFRKEFRPVLLISLVSAILLVFALAAWSPVRGAKSADEYVTKSGIKMILVHKGRFKMGNDLPTDPAKLLQPKMLLDGDYDEKPVHDVTISNDYYMSETEITWQQMGHFRMDWQDTGRNHPYATGMSWEDANAFCEWLSKAEHKNFRLSTEAEWEYAARAGSTTLFAPGDRPPADGQTNAWGLKNMNSGPAEWVRDWYGPYSIEPQTDPVGPKSGWARVVRGGAIMGEYGKELAGSVPYYRRTANRPSIAPEYRGSHPIGFRIVEASVPSTPPTLVQPPFPTEFIKQSFTSVKVAPDARKPWFRQRPLLTIPPEHLPQEELAAAGLDPALCGHNHSAGATVCPNGDILWVAFSSAIGESEYAPNTVFVVSRRRFGSEHWDLPELFYDFADVNDQSPLLSTENNTVHLYTGGVGVNGIPFRFQSSADSGATWSPVRLPLLEGPVGGYSTQPITSSFRGKDGTLYMASDAVDGESMLWATANNGETWRDTGGRTAGRHTAFVMLKDGSILAMGGKNTNIDGFMPRTVSRDGGKTWETPVKTEFAALSSNQRPTIIRLASGRLFFASDFQNREGVQPAGLTERGSFVALSNDEGRTWHIKPLTSALPHEAHILAKGSRGDRHGYGTLVYTIATQGPNGLIHLISSMNYPSQEFEMNEAWILSDAPASNAAPTSGAKEIHGEQRYQNGKMQASWTGKIDSNGNYQLSGPEKWFTEDGKLQYEVTWRDGNKTGAEVYYSATGQKIWEWRHDPSGQATWTQYWSNGNKKHESTWKDGKCIGAASAWTPAGELLHTYQFLDGRLVVRQGE